jgi:glutamyl-tRNA reductase
LGIVGSGVMAGGVAAGEAYKPRVVVANHSATVVRELVRHLTGDAAGLSLLHSLLADLDVTLCPLIPPPPTLSVVR